MATTYYEIADLATAVLFSDKRKKMANIDPNLLRSYPYCNKIVRQSVVKEQGGKDVRINVNVAGAAAADNFGPFQTFTRTVGDHAKQMTAQLRGTHTQFSFDILEEEFNSGDEHTIFDHVTNREQQAMIALTAKIEAQGWGNATYGDEVTPQGMLYHFPYCSGDGGFVGTIPTSYTDYQGLSTTTYSGLKSYGGAYAGVTFADLILKIRTALSKTKFLAPINPMLIDDYSTGYQFALYANLDTIIELEDLAKTQNEDLGDDLDSMNGRVMLRRIPFTEVPTLSDYTRDPIFGVNWGQMKHHVLRNWWMKKQKAPMDNNQPLVVSFDIFCEHQLVGYNRREAGFNFSKAA